MPLALRGAVVHVLDVEKLVEVVGWSLDLSLRHRMRAWRVQRRFIEQGSHRAARALDRFQASLVLGSDHLQEIVVLNLLVQVGVLFFEHL